MTATPDVARHPNTATGVWCCEFELSGEAEPTAVAAPTPGQRVGRVLVRLHGDPLGYLTLPLEGDGVDVARLVSMARCRFGERIERHLMAEGLPVGDGTDRPGAPRDACPNRVVPDEHVTVVVCTRNRGEALRGCLRRLAAVTYRPVTFLIVDNAPTDDTTRTVVESFAATDDRFAYVCEPVPGLSRARNRGLAHARGAYVAYTDDDVSVDPLWVHGLVRGFRAQPGVGCVTGLVCTAEITNDAEAYFDARAASWSTRCERQAFDRTGGGTGGVLYPYSAGIFGTGANVAFDRELLEGMGGFDEALGAGTRSRGGEDLDIFVRILRAGRVLVYDPAAIVWHHHRADDDALLRQMFGYGVGLSAYLTKLVLHPATRYDVLRRVPAGLRRMAAIRGTTARRLEARATAPRGALAREFAGFAAGPLLYARARLELRRRGDGR